MAASPEPILNDRLCPPPDPPALEFLDEPFFAVVFGLPLLFFSTPPLPAEELEGEESFDPPSARRRDGAEGVAKERRRLVGVGPSAGGGGRGTGEAPPPLLPLSLTRTAVCQLSDDVEESVEDVDPKAPVDFLFVPR
jgi:hypothetical protein